VPFVRGGAPGSDGEKTSAQAVAPRSSTLIAVAALVVAAPLATGSVCQYESGLSCIDVVERGRTVHLYADRIPQAAERTSPGGGQGEGAGGLVLSYTQWLWARMDQDLGPAPSVLFIGGGGYSLPARLLQSRPDAHAVAVEIDPLVTEVVHRHMPWAGAMIGRSGYDAGQNLPERNEERLGIVHADGRVYINETERRFDAVVMDAFSSGSVPAHLATFETYERLRTIVEGPVYVNLIDAPDGPLARGIHAILARLYPHVDAVQGPLNPRGTTNIVLVASSRPLVDLEASSLGYEPLRIAPGRAFTDDRGWIGHR
jgi:hypothetical protein